MNITKHFKGIKISLEGKDSFDFLNRLSSQDPASIKNGLAPSAFLDRRAKVISPFYLTHDENYHLIVSEEYKKDTTHYIDQMHFGEDLKINIQDITWTEERFLNTPTQTADHHLPDWHLDKTYKGAFYEKPIGNNMKHEFEIISYQALSPGIDNICFRGIMILDGPFDCYISRQSRCYPGQEVIEKIHQRRRPKEMFVCQIDSQLAGGLPLFKENRKVGELLGPIPGKIQKESLALAFVRSNKCVVGDILDLEDGLIVKLIAASGPALKKN